MSTFSLFVMLTNLTKLTKDTCYIYLLLRYADFGQESCIVKTELVENCYAMFTSKMYCIISRMNTDSALIVICCITPLIHHLSMVQAQTTNRSAQSVKCHAHFFPSHISLFSSPNCLISCVTFITASEICVERS